MMHDIVVYLSTRDAGVTLLLGNASRHSKKAISGSVPQTNDHASY